MSSPAHCPRDGPTAALLAACLTLLLGACADDPALTPLGPMADRLEAISDGGHDGNVHFFFLPPLAPDVPYSGDFDPTYAAEVRICEWDGTACVGADIAHFTTSSGSGSEIVRIDPVAEHYIVNWHTKRANNGAGLDPTKAYRITVSSDGYQLGFADIVVSSGKKLKNVNMAEYIALKGGVTLPIKFRIEVGAVPADGKASVTAGESHSCMLDAVGAAYCWGRNDFGQLGSGTVSLYVSSPVAVSGGHQFTEIHAGGYVSCALDIDGAPWCWGHFYRAFPTQVATGMTFTSITLGLWHACGVVASGEAYCWGLGNSGQLGNGEYPDGWSLPVLVGGGWHFAAVSAGTAHTCGVTDADEVLCWGSNNRGQLGRGSLTESRSATPAPAMAGLALVDVAAGGVHTCGLTATGAAYCVGFNHFGQLGGGFTTNTAPWTSPTPVAVQGGHAFAALAPGTYHTCGIDGAGAAFCWGYNGYGELGTGAAEGIYSSPQAVTGGNQWTVLASGELHTCGVTTDNVVRCWGSNFFGQAGTGGTSVAVPSPTEVVGLP